ncbi:MAG: DNA starvation/stationary phase protection protein [Moraxellaceae bacterium]|nr:DNA starvation/stationary phase protection protein [Pseudobdellovibrionaceae bacterium]
MNMKKAKLGFKSNSQKEMSQGLSTLLADSYMLYIKTHNFHWNVEGPMFNTLHLMFMDQYTELWNSLDLIAERIRALGEYAPGSYKQFAALTSIKESEKVPKATKMIEELLAGHEIVIQTARKLFPLAEDEHDEVSCDLLTQRLQVHEKTAWMLRSLLAT